MLDLLDNFEQTLAQKKISIVEFAESDDFCNKPLYPRQRVLLKLFNLEELEGWEEDVLNYWIQGGRNGSEILISPNIRERVEYLRDREYDHFREVTLVGGRRSSKGFVTGIQSAKIMWDTLQLQDPGSYYGVDPTKEIYFSCVAASEQQAKEFQFADLINTIEGCKAFDPYIQQSLETEVRVATPADLRRMGQMRKRRGAKQVRVAARLRGKALAANAGTIRGSASMVIVFDEMAHMIETAEGKASATQVYGAAEPSLDQFGKAVMLFCNPPEAPVWMADLSHKPIGEVQIGDKVIGWQKREGKINRELCESTVLNVIRRHAPIVKVTMESGRVFRCTPDHRWLTLSSGGNKATHDGEWYAPAKIGRKLAYVVDPAPEIPDDLKRDAAWLAGIWDGEGHAAKEQAMAIGQSKTHNPDVCAEIERVLNRLGFEWVYDEDRYRILGGKNGRANRCLQLYTNFISWVQPVRRQGIIDKVIGAGRWRQEDRVANIEPDGEGEVVALTTTTVNYICNGYASRNCNSSPYSKIGKFFERHEEAMLPFDPARDIGTIGEDGKLEGNGNPQIFSFQFPSWALFEGWEQDPERRFRKAITVSPDWNTEAKNEDGTDKYDEETQQQIISARLKEAANPDTYKVERRGKFAEVQDAYLNPEMIDRMYSGVPDGYDDEGRLKLNPIITNWGEQAHVYYTYRAHLDPSSTTAGFGFALGHIETFTHKDGSEREHVVFDIIKRWQPQFFEGGAIDWEIVLAEVLSYIDIFRPVQVTFDQFQSDQPMQWLTREIQSRNLYGTNVGLKFRTNERNWNQSETFKTALYQGLVHAPSPSIDPTNSIDLDWSMQELKFLVKKVSQGGAKYPRVDKQDIGPVQTKDMADCIMEVVEGLIGNRIAMNVRETLSKESMALGGRGGYQIGGALQGLKDLPALQHFYGAQRQGDQMMPPGQGRVGRRPDGYRSHVGRARGISRKRK